MGSRSGGSISLQSNQVAIMRVQMHPKGYRTQAQKGNVKDEFNPITLGQEFALEVAQQEPLPKGCAF